MFDAARLPTVAPVLETTNTFATPPTLMLTLLFPCTETFELPLMIEVPALTVIPVNCEPLPMK